SASDLRSLRRSWSRTGLCHLRRHKTVQEERLRGLLHLPLVVASQGRKRNNNLRPLVSGSLEIELDLITWLADQLHGVPYREGTKLRSFGDIHHRNLRLRRGGALVLQHHIRACRRSARFLSESRRADA